MSFRRSNFGEGQVSDLRQRGLVSFRKKQSALDLGLQDTVLRSQIFVPHQQFLIDGAGDVGQHASPNHSRASLKLIVEPGLYMLLRFQKAAGRGNYETGNRAFSKCLRFLTIRVLRSASRGDGWRSISHKRPHRTDTSQKMVSGPYGTADRVRLRLRLFSSLTWVARVRNIPVT